jgi:hypothetical protein
MLNEAAIAAEGTRNVDTPEVERAPVLSQRARFYRDESGRDMVEISFVGSKETLRKKVTPQHMAQFRDAWNAYCDGLPPGKRAGTPLTDVAGLGSELAESYVQRNVHTLEELAALNDGECQGLGHGTLTFREKARRMLAERGARATMEARARVGEVAGTIGKAADASGDLAEIKSALSELTNGINTLVALLTGKAEGTKKAKGGKADE